MVKTGSSARGCSKRVVETEARIREALGRLLAGRIALTVAPRSR
jgi:hypothetical protein